MSEGAKHNMTTQKSFFSQALAGNEQTFFNCFEPFDCPPPPQWMLDAAKSAEVEIDPLGNEFQIGMLMNMQETPGSAMSIAGSQCGKSITALIEVVIMASGQIPVSLRHEKGVDTGVPRIVNEENIARFGQKEDGSCGNIVGCGIYPKEKIPPLGSQIWIATYKEAKEKFWRRKFAKVIPPYFLNAKRGVDGFSELKQTYFFGNGNTVSYITYEQDFRRVEAEKAWLICLDEEPPDRRFWISALEHSVYLRAFFSPINGLSWMYHDVYLPILSGQNKYCKIFQCSQYGSPYHSRKKVALKIKTYKPYELKARVWGQFSDMAGRPFYTFDLTQKNLRNYIPRHSYAKIQPTQKPDTIRDAIKLKMLLEPAEKSGEDVWDIYEELRETDTYWLSADVAKGNENPDAAEDASVAYVRRMPREGEVDPVMVATLYSRMRNVEFAWMCIYGAVFYNLCLMAPEATGEDGAVFVATISGYPYVYKHVVTNDKTRRLKEMDGFNTKGNTRKLVFDLAGTWIYDRPENPKIYHYELLKEYSECIVGKEGRPDHSDKGHTDCLMSFGISEYVRIFAKNQIRNNRSSKYSLTKDPDPMTFPNIFGNRFIKETRKILGSSQGLDNRARFDKKYATQTM